MISSGPLNLLKPNFFLVIVDGFVIAVLFLLLLIMMAVFLSFQGNSSSTPFPYFFLPASNCWCHLLHHAGSV